MSSLADKYRQHFQATNKAGEDAVYDKYTNGQMKDLLRENDDADGLYTLKIVYEIWCRNRGLDPEKVESLVEWEAQPYRVRNY